MSELDWQLILKFNGEYLTWCEDEYRIYDPKTKEAIDWLLEVAKESLKTSKGNSNP